MLRKRDLSNSYETMKTIVFTPQSSPKSFTPIAATESEIKDTSDYFPGCRRDANCNCDICLASINATLDLMPQSIQRSSLTNKHSSSKFHPITPISFDPSSFLTPKSRSKSLTRSPQSNSKSKICFHGDLNIKKKYSRYGLVILKLVLCLSFVFGLELGFPWMISKIFQPKLSVKIVRTLGEKSWGSNDLSKRIVFLESELKGLVNEDAQICSSVSSKWKINQDGLLLNSRCVLYKSMVEELSIWGWPLQTSGLLTTEFSSRSLTILSGRVTEWLNGEVRYLIRRENSTWTQEKWSGSAALFDKNTWILEYKQSSIIMENTGLVSASWEFLKLGLTKGFGKLKQEFWGFSTFSTQQTHRIPT